MRSVKITLAAARVNAGMTQEDVAKKLKVSKKTVINWEKGIVTPSLLYWIHYPDYIRCH